MKRNKKQNIRLLALILILLLGIGFAALTTTLKIDGTLNVSRTSWDVHFENVSITQGSVTANPAPTSDNTTTTEMTYTINFTKPGDFYEFTVDIVNDGTIDAMVEDVSNKVYSSNGTTEITLPGYLTSTVTYYESGAIIEPNHLIAKNTSEKIVVRIEFRQDINASDLPSSGDTTVVFKFKGDYKQADGNAVKPPCPSSSCVYAYPVFDVVSREPNWPSGDTQEEWDEFYVRYTQFKNAELSEVLPHTWYYNTGNHVTEYETFDPWTGDFTVGTTASHQPTTLQSTDYKTDYNELIQETGKNYFVAMQLDDNNKISKGYVCYKDPGNNKTKCWEPPASIDSEDPIWSVEELSRTRTPDLTVILIKQVEGTLSEKSFIEEVLYYSQEECATGEKKEDISCFVGRNKGYDIGIYCSHSYYECSY